jgi:CxxC motif-containing protein
MKEVEMICIQCPLGCKIKVQLDDDNKVLDISGFTCKSGKEYAMQEVTDPHRVITTSIKVIDGKNELVSVKTNKPVPKRLIQSIMDIIKNSSVHAPVELNQVVISNIANSGADIITTKKVEKI